MKEQKKTNVDSSNKVTSETPMQQQSFINKHFTKIVFGIVTLAIAILALVMFYPSGQPKAELSTVNQDVLIHGKALYEASCATCHGIEGAGNNQARIPALDGSMHSWHHSDEYLINQIRNGNANMPAVGANEGWSDADIEAVLSYFKQWWRPQHKRAQQGSIGE